MRARYTRFYVGVVVLGRNAAHNRLRPTSHNRRVSVGDSISHAAVVLWHIRAGLGGRRGVCQNIATQQTQTNHHILAQRRGARTRRQAVFHVQNRQRAHKSIVRCQAQNAHDQIARDQRGRVHTVSDVQHESRLRLVRQR